MTGQAAQILFLNGQTNGYGTQATNPNWLIAIEEKTTGLGDTPTDVKFYGYVFEVGTQGLYVGEGANDRTSTLITAMWKTFNLLSMQSPPLA